MDIVIIAQFCGDVENIENNNSRFLYLGKLLSAENEVEIITTDFLHGTKRHFVGRHEYGGCKITQLHECGYPTNICLRRFKSHHELSVNVRQYLGARKKPDVIYCAVPSLDVAHAAAKYAQKNGIRFIVDVQDLWPEAFTMVFNVPLIGSLAFYPMKLEANYIYGAADEIVAVSQTYADRALRVNKKCREAHSVFLGTDLSDFDRFRDENSVQKPKDEIWIAYIGTLGASYDLTSVIEALAVLKRKGKTILKFIVMGDGPRKAEFEALANQTGICSEFTGMLPYPKMVGRLCSCDIAINPITKGAAQSIINKVGDYAAAGLPVVNTQECLEYRNLIDKYHCGINCQNSNVGQLADALSKLVENVAMRKQMGDSNRRLAEERFDRAASYGALAELILKRSTT